MARRNLIEKFAIRAGLIINFRFPLLSLHFENFLLQLARHKRLFYMEFIVSMHLYIIFDLS